MGSYLDKKREIKGNSAQKKSSVTNIVPETDVMKAMEIVEETSELREQANPRKKTPPGGKNGGDVRGEDRKRLIRELGRKPSEEKVSLYVRKPSEEQKDPEQTEQKTPATVSGSAKKFMDSMARRSMEVPADFLDTISK